MKNTKLFIGLLGVTVFAVAMACIGIRFCNNNIAIEEECLREHLRMIRLVISWHKSKTGEFPKNLVEAAREQHYPDGVLINSLDDTKCPIRVTNVFDRLGGWYYNPETGEVRANSPRVRIWTLPPFGRTQDPTVW